jgi:RNA methyltransferase, TrmH family
MTITSPHNEQLKQVRKLAGRKWRDKTRTFVAEGEDLIDAARAAGWAPELVLCEAGSGLVGEEVAPQLLRQVSQLGSGTRALAVYPQRWAPAPAGPVCVALWGVNDPGNVGTVLRSALAFGAGSVALGPGTADPYGSKAVRASMGAIFAVPVARVARVEELPGRTVALAARQGRPLAVLDAPELTLVVGAEREGLPADVAAACDETAHIPIASESLNAAMAATIGLYEMTRVARA